MTTDELLGLVTAHYLISSDFNGFPVKDLPASHDELVELLRALVERELISLSLGSSHPNPYVKAFPPAPFASQLKALTETDDLRHVTAYPAPRHLATVVDAVEYGGRPFTLLLALGAPQLLPPAFFDLMVLESYRNDPRYAFWSNETGGTISVTDAFYRSDQMRPADQVLLETFGFGFDESLHRVVCVFPIYLSRLSPEHQQIWAARELEGDYKLHPAYYVSSILGDWPEREPIFSAFLEELDQIQKMCAVAGLPPLVRASFKEAKPANFTFLLRPTLKELQDFYSTLDKLMSENLNRTFFASQQLQLETDTERKDGKMVVTQKGTITLLSEWLQHFGTDDRTEIDEMVETFREVRRLRQRPAHVTDDNVFNVEFYDAQRDLVLRAYQAVRMLRLILANYPGLENYDGVPDWLFEGKIYDY